MTTQDKIKELYTALMEMQLEKNRNYGDAALSPMKVFTMVKPESSICVRLDDKLNRVRNADVLRKNDLCDLVGYLILLLIEEGATKEDILGLID